MFNEKMEELAETTYFQIDHDLAKLTLKEGLSEIEHLRVMHAIGDQLVTFAKQRSREIQDEICEKAGPEIRARALDVERFNRVGRFLAGGK